MEVLPGDIKDVSVPIFKVTTPAKKQIARAFGLKAQKYDANATIQKELLSRLNHRIHNYCSEGVWADLGCGTGFLEQILKQNCNFTTFLGIDIAFESLRILKSRQLQKTFQVNADIEALPFKTNCLQGVILASVLQWFADPVPVLNKIASILNNNGIFLFAVFVKGSFWELNLLRQESGFEIPVYLPDEKIFYDTLKQSNMSVMETELYNSTVYYPSAFDLLKSISAIGGTAVSGNRLSRSQLFRFCTNFESRFRCDRGIPITYRALIGSAKKGSIQ